MMQTAIIVIEQWLLYFPLLCGAYISISLMKIPDLAIEAAYIMGAIVGSKALVVMKGATSLSAVVAITGFGMLGGALVGIMSSLLTQYAHLPHLLSSILTIGVFHGIAQYILQAGYISISQLPNVLDFLPFEGELSEIILLSMIGIIILVCGVIFLRSQLGYACVIYGSNPYFFRHYGISTSFVFIVGLLLSNTLAGISGFLIAQKTGFADSNMGFGIALFCITSLILGKTMYNRPIPSLLIPSSGLLLYLLLQQMLLRIGFNLKYFTMVQSFIILLILITGLSRSKDKRTIDHLGV